MLDQKVTVSELKEKVDRFISEREWNKYHKPKDLSISIVLESSELLEHFQWLTDDEIETMLKDSQKLQQIESELADIVIYCLSLSNTLHADLSNVVLRKLEEDEKKYSSEKVKGSYRKYNQISSQK
jgi:NTP pyrophosphatase (non-canonical NTP hydrolase)